MSVEYICSQLVTMIHAPIRIMDPNGTIKMSYGSIEDHEDPLICDSSFRMELLADKQNGFPLIIQEEYQILYGVVRDADGKPMWRDQSVPEKREAVSAAFWQKSTESISKKLIGSGKWTGRLLEREF